MGVQIEGSTFYADPPEHSLSAPEIFIDWHSQQGSRHCWMMKGKAWILRLVIQRLYLWYLRSYIFTDDASKNKMATDDEHVTYTHDRG